MNLIGKYNVPAPRYTSYPTVPMWDNPPGQDQWKESVRTTFVETNADKGISVYIHLPYCESLCTYCGCNTRITINHEVEMPYIMAVLGEWSLYLEVFGETPRIKEIHLGGGTPTFFSPANLKYLLEGIFSGAQLCSDPEFSFEAHPQNTTREHLQVLFDLGFRRVSYGIQDFDPKVQDIIHRFQSFDQVKKAVEDAREIGYTSVNFDLIYGLPLQTRLSIVDTINKVEILRPDRIAFYSYAHVPWIKPGQRKFTEADLPSPEDKLLFYELGREMLRDCGYHEIGMDHFALEHDDLFKAKEKGCLHRNFMGYTVTHTQLLIGLGASSISDTWYGFAQNVKTIEDYLELVKARILPFFKGHLLNAEDLMVREHTLNIMCKGETSWHTAWEQGDHMPEIKARLMELVKDGLIELGKQNLKVTPKGKHFLRNICMAFDLRLWRKTPESQMFSQAI